MVLKNWTRSLGALFGCACVLCAAPARAITLSVSALTLPGNTADNSDTSPPVAQNLSTISVLDSGGSAPDLPAGTIDARTRYTQVLTADSDPLNFASITRSATSNYRINITVTPDHPLYTVYSITINTSRLGALVVRDEGGAAGTSDTSGVSGTLNGFANALLSLADPGALNTNSTTVIPINQSNSLVLTGLTGTQNLQLDFLWTASASSGNNVVSGGDEGVVLLGQPGTVSQVGAADDYPGTSGRSPQSADGHFVNVVVEVTQFIPEPSSLLLGSVGGLSLGIALWRRRRR